MVFFLRASIILVLCVCLLFILVMEIFIYFQISNLWYYFLCSLFFAFTFYFRQAYNPPIRLPSFLSRILPSLWDFSSPAESLPFTANTSEFSHSLLHMWNGFHVRGTLQFWYFRKAVSLSIIRKNWNDASILCVLRIFPRAKAETYKSSWIEDEGRGVLSRNSPRV